MRGKGLSYCNIMENTEYEYVGFWSRTGAALIDTIIVISLMTPVSNALFRGLYWIDATEMEDLMDFVLSWALPAVAVVTFWVIKQATPGKMAVGAKIVDAKTGNAPSTGQYIGRYLAYYISMFPLFLGIFWIAFDSRRQGWHDKLAGTVVVRPKNRKLLPVSFPDA